MYNEGVDIPEIDTILFLRPTESLTIFLQQLGRGLRLSEGKECLTVLDFIGQANKKYNFEEKVCRTALSQQSQHAVRGEKGLCITAEGLLYPAGKEGFRSQFWRIFAAPSVTVPV